MNTNTYTKSSFFEEFQAGLSKISTSLGNADQFHLNLYYSSMISMMEKYLFDVFVAEIEGNDDAFRKMCLTDRFKNTSYPLAQILMSDIKKTVINTVKNMVWHRLPDVDYLYKNTFDIKFNVSGRLRGIIAIRHHIVHRNGVDIDGNSVDINADILIEAMDVVSDFLLDIDKKYYSYKTNPVEE